MFSWNRVGCQVHSQIVYGGILVGWVLWIDLPTIYKGFCNINVFYWRYVYLYNIECSNSCLCLNIFWMFVLNSHLVESFFSFYFHRFNIKCSYSIICSCTDYFINYVHSSFNSKQVKSLHSVLYLIHVVQYHLWNDVRLCIYVHSDILSSDGLVSHSDHESIGTLGRWGHHSVRNLSGFQKVLNSSISFALSVFLNGCSVFWGHVIENRFCFSSVCIFRIVCCLNGSLCCRVSLDLRNILYRYTILSHWLIVFLGN